MHKKRIIVPDQRYGKVWALYGFMGFTDPDSTVRKMQDTVINNVLYQRFSSYGIFDSDDGKEMIYNYMYINCNAKNTLFQNDKAFSKKYANGCPVQRHETYWPKNNLRMKGEFEFIRNTLTAQEMKVFDTWENYAKMHTVKPE